MALTLPDPKKHYVRLETWGSLLIPIDMVPAFKDVIAAERSYVDGKYQFKFDGRTISFESINSDDLTAQIAAHKLEN